MLDVDDRAALLHEVRRHRLDVVVEAQDQPAGAQRGTARLKDCFGVRDVIENLKQTHGVELAVTEEPRSHDITDDLVPDHRRRIPDRRFARLDPANRGVSLRQRLLEKEAIAAADLEQ